jgi:hypothetical protein
MSITPAEQMTSEDAPSLPVPSALVPREIDRHKGAIAWSSFFFALLQSICGAVVAVNGLRLAIGIGSLALSTGAGAAVVRFHADWIRRPMMAVAFVGSLLNLAIFLHVRYLRNRPASQWRRQAVSPRKLRMERLQLVLSLATLVLLGIEEYLHFGFHHSM